MAIKNVTATRMNLLSLKGQKQTASRGHKLLKDKQDGLMKEFLAIIRQAKTLRSEVEEALRLSNRAFLEAQAVMPNAVLKNVLSVPSQRINLKVQTKNVMSVRIPQFKTTSEGAPFGYGFAQTRGELDIAISKFFKVFEMLLELSEIEKSAENLAIEIEKTRRRVNALEYRLIPDLNDTIKFIQMKMAESERAAVVQTMAIKKMIEQNEAKKRAAVLAAA